MQKWLLWALLLLCVLQVVNTVLLVLLLRTKAFIVNEKERKPLLKDTSADKPEQNMLANSKEPASTIPASHKTNPENDPTEVNPLPDGEAQLMSSDVPSTTQMGEASVYSVTTEQAVHPFVEVKVFTYQGGDHDFQDAADYNSETGTVAIADGATVSVCQGEWAEMLTRSFVENSINFVDDQERRQWWTATLTKWNDAVAPRQEVWKSRPAEFWMTTKLFKEAGGCATFLGFTLHPTKDSVGYKMYAIGDCVGFWFQEHQFIKSEPAIAEFDCTPVLLSTRRPFPLDALQMFQGASLPGNLLVMATDALAEYFVKYRPWEQHSDFWNAWWFKDNEDFASWAADLKREDTIRPDDYTMILVRFA